MSLLLGLTIAAKFTITIVKSTITIDYQQLTSLLRYYQDSFDSLNTVYFQSVN